MEVFILVDVPMMRQTNIPHAEVDEVELYHPGAGGTQYVF